VTAKSPSTNLITEPTNSWAREGDRHKRFRTEAALPEPQDLTFIRHEKRRLRRLARRCLTPRSYAPSTWTMPAPSGLHLDVLASASRSEERMTPSLPAEGISLPWASPAWSRSSPHDATAIPSHSVLWIVREVWDFSLGVPPWCPQNREATQ
jgi:hypothetical protein